MVRAAKAPTGTRRRAAAQAKAGVLKSVSRRTAPPRMSSGYSYSNPGPVGRLGRIAGRALGGYLGGPAGALAGDALGGMAHYIGKVFGSGDYVTNSDRVKQNVLVNDAQVPQFGSSPNTVHIRHREYLGDIVSSATAGAFNVQTFSINPGQSASFPWLSNVVNVNFQQYRINGMLFEYRSMSADALNSTNTALGSVIMATDYDSADSAFTSKAQMENTEFGISSKPSCSMIHAIECARSQTAISELYVRPGNVPANADIRLYDLGKFYIATTGMQGASVNLGELWVSYDITFFKAIQLVAGAEIKTAHYQLNSANLATQPVSVLTTGNNFDTIGLSFPSGGLSVTFPITIPNRSCWLVYLTNSTNAGGAAAASSITLTGSNGLSLLRMWSADGAQFLVNPNPSPYGAAQRSVDFIGVYQYDNTLITPGSLPTLTTAAPTTPFGSYTSGDLVVTLVNGNIV